MVLSEPRVAGQLMGLQPGGDKCPPLLSTLLSLRRGLGFQLVREPWGAGSSLPAFFSAGPQY